MRILDFRIRMYKICHARTRINTKANFVDTSSAEAENIFVTIRANSWPFQLLDL